ncbi:hypothetical protein L6R29_26050, partial [Myxococcota bacterium]|nr:hypothetical protein [Myxococcota bacterium]
FAKRGKPKKGAQPDKVCWKIIGDLEEKKEEIEKGKSRLGRFVLATTMAESKLSGEEALKRYKVQGSAIERGFRFLIALPDENKHKHEEKTAVHPSV